MEDRKVDLKIKRLAIVTKTNRFMSVFEAYWLISLNAMTSGFCSIFSSDMI